MKRLTTATDFLLLEVFYCTSTFEGPVLSTDSAGQNATQLRTKYQKPFLKNSPELNAALPSYRSLFRFRQTLSKFILGNLGLCSFI